jgi:hypothetical protein
MSEPYAMVETRLHGHPKWLGLSHAARGLWIDGLIYSKSLGNGGLIPTAYVRFATATEPANPAWIEELVSRRLWEPVEGGWLIHDYDDHQKMTPSELGRRSAEARRVKFGSADPRANVNAPGTAPGTVHGTVSEHGTERNGTEGKGTETETLAPAPAVAREPDLLFEAVCEVTDTDWHSLTESARKRLNRMVKELRQVGATPADVRARSRRYHERYPDTVLTDTALSKWWATLGDPVSREPEESDYPAEPEPQPMDPEGQAKLHAMLAGIGRVDG